MSKNTINISTNKCVPTYSKNTVTYQEGGLNNDFIPKDDDGATIEGNGSYIDTWKAMEELVENGLTKSIGVSNFNKRQIQDILDVATVKPVNNQVPI